VTWRVELLDTARHNRSEFTCGVDALDRYLQVEASQDARKRVSATFCLIAEEAPSDIAGYYTLSPGAVRLTGVPEDVRRGLPRYPDVPVFLLGRLEVSRDRQGQGIGSLLLRDALARVLRQELPAVAVVVDAIDESAAGFYRRYGFVQFAHQPTRLMLSVAAVPRDLHGIGETS
jgi:predicted N-acetyltransferase YhbS